MLFPFRPEIQLHDGDSCRDSGARLVVMMPALNEALTVGDMVRRIPRTIPGIHQVQVIVVDDGSTDDTGRLAREAGAEVVRHSENMGLGRSFADGLDASLRRGASIIVTMDSDGQFTPEDIPALIAPILNGNADFVTCTRFGDPELVPKMRTINLWGNRMMCHLVNRLSNGRQRFSDVSCGFRAFTRETALQLTLFGHVIDQELFIDLVKKGIRIKEVPLRVRGVREFGESRVAHNLWEFGLRTAMTLLRAARDTRPLKFFGTLSAAFAGLGVLQGAFIVIWWLATGGTKPYQAMLIGATLFSVLGLLLFVFALIADMLGRMRQIEEEILTWVRSERFANEALTNQQPTAFDTKEAA